MQNQIRIQSRSSRRRCPCHCLVLYVQARGAVVVEVERRVRARVPVELRTRVEAKAARAEVAPAPSLGVERKLGGRGGKGAAAAGAAAVGRGSVGLREGASSARRGIVRARECLPRFRVDAHLSRRHEPARGVGELVEFRLVGGGRATRRHARAGALAPARAAAPKPAQGPQHRLAGEHQRDTAGRQRVHIYRLVLRERELELLLGDPGRAHPLGDLLLALLEVVHGLQPGVRPLILVLSRLLALSAPPLRDVVEVVVEAASGALGLKVKCLHLVPGLFAAEREPAFLVLA
mmetsp:Transcript_12679/g.32104  ORF Transcript_12679/g.32104 Transcript_12679/m.32104 type:complete len:291 (-) Transcript_12679:370-1242(-)